MAGLLGYASYLPTYRLGPDSGVRTPRVVASFDEDSTTMAVAAASALGALDPAQVLFATSTPAYLDKTNATALVAALRLPSAAFAADHIGTARSTFAALRGAINGGGLVAAADVRIGKPGSSDERGGGDGGAALLFGEGPAIADVLAITSATTEVLDRWRSPRSLTGEQWEERFGFEEFADLARETGASALASAGVEEADHVLLTSSNSAITKRVGSLVKGRISTGSSPIGFSGAADPLIALAGVLDVAGPGETILLLSAVDGCDALVLRTTPEIVSRRQPRSLAEQLDAGRPVPYTTYLAWRGLLEREMPRRPEPDRPAGPPSARNVAWKFGFVGSRCAACGFGHLPPIRVCRQCGATDQMELLPASTLSGRVATFTIDRLAYSPSPPVIDVVVDFDGGGRCALEVADADPASIEVGTRVELTFRTLFTAGNVHNYFWKARAV
jgi:3-hydroxy-3-methylglutaryl CoA synthase/uncharacterized OB-fold protein